MHGYRPRTTKPEQAGFALLLAILALMLLTVLGLTIATTTSTELQIATNYRWSQQALYNAEAGLEFGKSLLRGENWSLILPPPRRDGGGNLLYWLPSDGNDDPGVAQPVPPFTRSTRNLENWQCDERGEQQGYGVVVDNGGSGGGPGVGPPYEYVTTVFGETLNGAFTLWIRRPFQQDPTLSGKIADYPGNPNDGTDDKLVLTSEGIAPFSGTQATSAFTQANRASRTLEVTLGRTPSDAAFACGTRAGQAGGAPEGGNFAGCDPITQEGVTQGLPGQGN